MGRQVLITGVVVGAVSVFVNGYTFFFLVHALHRSVYVSNDTRSI